MSEDNVVPIKEKLSFNDIFDQNTVKQIKWGDEFKAWPVERQLNYAKKLASAMNEAASKMQEDRDRLLEVAREARAEAAQAAEAAKIAKQSMTQAVLQGNDMQAVQNDTIMKLQAEVRAKEQVIENLNIKLLAHGG